VRLEKAIATRRPRAGRTGLPAPTGYLELRNWMRSSPHAHCPLSKKFQPQTGGRTSAIQFFAQRPVGADEIGSRD
ncbi:hypothetical protein, partial [Sphingobium sp.]|uniref:hypothetical protein n=1 Tax=Sphingobium sp. TaxID=1912891 RepID=UPI002B66A5A9